METWIKQTYCAILKQYSIADSLTLVISTDDDEKFIVSKKFLSEISLQECINNMGKNG